MAENTQNYDHPGNSAGPDGSCTECGTSPPKHKDTSDDVFGNIERTNKSTNFDEDW